MKKCRFCAELIQDEAIVCKHCGRDLLPQPAVTASVNVWKKIAAFPIILGSVAAVVALAYVGSVIRQMSPASALRHGSGKCVLRAVAAVVTSDAPIARLKGWDSDVLAIRNTDSESLNDLDITIYGLVTTETSVHRPTGAYRLRKGAGTTDGQLMTFSLNDFQKPSGESWVPLTMSVAEINLRASVRGEFCSADIRPHASVMDVIGR